MCHIEVHHYGKNTILRKWNISFNIFLICVDDYVYVLIGVFYKHFYETIQFLSYYSFYRNFPTLTLSFFIFQKAPQLKYSFLIFFFFYVVPAITVFYKEHFHFNCGKFCCWWNRPTYLPTYLHTYFLTYLPTFLSTNQRTYLPTYLPTYPPTYQPTYLPTYLPT